VVFRHTQKENFPENEHRFYLRDKINKFKISFFFHPFGTFKGFLGTSKKWEYE